jgi:outer membrane scaffolding protein for murein synthesis (MipA/OmpV family)
MHAHHKESSMTTVLRTSAFAAALALGALAAVPAAHARSDVQFSIGIGTSPYYVQPAPIYVAPAYGYGNGNYYYRTQRNGPWGDRDGDGIANRYDRDHRHGGGRRDADRDGVPNRYDRDRDGDGVRNSVDRRPDNPYRY